MAPTLLSTETLTLVAFTAKSSSVCHAIAGTPSGTSGETYALGPIRVCPARPPSPHGTHVTPTTLVPSLAHVKVVAPTLGKHHTVVIDENGDGWSLGRAQEGQTENNAAIEKIKIFNKMLFQAPSAPLSSVSCGDFFTACFSSVGRTSLHLRPLSVRRSR